MVYTQGLKEADVARYFNVSPQAVNKALQPFKRIINSNDEVAAFRENETQILDSLKMKLLYDMVDKDKRKKATLGNVAYAYDKLATHSRLEKGQGISFDLHAVIINMYDSRVIEVEKGK